MFFHETVKAKEAQKRKVAEREERKPEGVAVPKQQQVWLPFFQYPRALGSRLTGKQHDLFVGMLVNYLNYGTVKRPGSLAEFKVKVLLMLLKSDLACVLCRINK